MSRDPPLSFSRRTAHESTVWVHKQNRINQAVEGTFWMERTTSASGRRGRRAQQRRQGCRVISWTFGWRNVLLLNLNYSSGSRCRAAQPLSNYPRVQSTISFSATFQSLSNFPSPPPPSLPSSRLICVLQRHLDSRWPGSAVGGSQQRRRIPQRLRGKAAKASFQTG